MFAAGPMVQEDDFSLFAFRIQMCLTNLCRESIRKHLLQISNVNLFVRVSELGLPAMLQEYLLYNISLNKNDQVAKQSSHKNKHQLTDEDRSSDSEHSVCSRSSFWSDFSYGEDTDFSAELFS